MEEGVPKCDPKKKTKNQTVKVNLFPSMHVNSKGTELTKILTTLKS